MKTRIHHLIILVLLAPTLLFAQGKTGEPKPAEPGHAFRGVVTRVLEDRRLVMIKHEEIPGFMKAMTMAFSVPDAVWPLLQPEVALTARMHRQERGWRIDGVKLLAGDGATLASGVSHTVTLTPQADGAHTGRFVFTPTTTGRWRICVPAKFIWVDVLHEGQKLTSVACDHNLPADFAKGVTYELAAGTAVEIVVAKARTPQIDLLVDNPE